VAFGRQPATAQALDHWIDWIRFQGGMVPCSNMEAEKRGLGLGFGDARSDNPYNSALSACLPYGNPWYLSITFR